MPDFSSILTVLLIANRSLKLAANINAMIATAMADSRDLSPGEMETVMAESRAINEALQAYRQPDESASREAEPSLFDDSPSEGAAPSDESPS